MANPTTRVLALLELLQSHGLMSGSELARRLEVDPRTLRRYIQSLEEMGIPVLAERGRDGGYRLMTGFKLPPMMFSNEEAQALALGLVAARQLGMAGQAQAGTSALSKLERVMPDKLQRQVRAIADTVALDVKRATHAGDAALLSTLSAAAQQQQRVLLHYVSPQHAHSEREVDPHGLAFLNGSWYLVAHCHLRRDRRSFRIDRIRSAQALPKTFARPASFDPIAYLSQSIAMIPRAHAVRVLLHTDLASASNAVALSLGMLQAVDGGVLLHCQADTLDWMARELARLPFAFDVVHPVGLRTALVDHATALLDRHSA